jgi:pilus assembly protein CpaE
LTALADAARTGATAERPATDEIRPVPRITLSAFCETAGLAAAVKEAAADRRMARAHVTVEVGGLAKAVEFYREAATPNLILVESFVATDRLLAGLDALAEVCDADTKVVVVGHVNDVELYRALIRRGVSEYLVAPVSPVLIIATVAGLYSSPSAKPLGRTIAFIGAKGGVGSSTVAHNVAHAIAGSLDSDVVIADLDLPFGTAGLDFNLDPAQGIAEAVEAPDRLDDILLDRLLARCSERLSLLAAPATLDRTYDFAPEAFVPVIDIAQSGLPAVVIDLPHGWTGWIRSTLVSADEIVLTVEPDLGNLRNAKNIADLLRETRRNDRPPRLVMNRAGMPKRPEIKVEDFAEALGLVPEATIPFDPHLFGTAANNGQMVAEIDPNSPAVAAFEGIARAVTGRGAPAPARRGRRRPLLARLRGKAG